MHFTCRDAGGCCAGAREAQSEDVLGSVRAQILAEQAAASRNARKLKAKRRHPIHVGDNTAPGSVCGKVRKGGKMF